MAAAFALAAACGATGRSPTAPVASAGAESAAAPPADAGLAPTASPAGAPKTTVLVGAQLAAVQRQLYELHAAAAEASDAKAAAALTRVPPPEGVDMWPIVPSCRVAGAIPP
jgi:hypothetical protein